MKTPLNIKEGKIPCPEGRCSARSSLSQYILILDEAPKLFHSRHMQGSTPCPAYFEELFMNYSTMKLAGGYGERQDAAVNDEQHGELLVVGVHV